jgi:hypothetical protein
MAKHREKELAQKFFVEWGKTLDEILKDLLDGGFQVSKRQLWQWSKDGKWRALREEYQQGQTTTMERLQAFVDSELDEMDREKKAGRKVSVQRLHAVQNMFEQLDRMKRQARQDLERHDKDEGSEEEGGGVPMSIETFARLFEEEFGLAPL